MRHLLATLTLVLSGVTSGCLIAPGHAFAGKKAARTIPVQNICFEDRTGQCSRIKTITRERPAEKFLGLIAGVKFGGAMVQSSDKIHGAFRYEALAAVIIGKGNYAVSGRISAWGDRWNVFERPEETAGTSATGMTTVVHLGLPPRLELYGGAGFAPWANLSSQTGSDSGIALRGVAGLRVILTGSDEKPKIISNFEVDYNSYSFKTRMSTVGITGSLGIFF